MGDVGRAVDRGGSGGAGAVHGDARISSAPSMPSRTSRSRSSRATRCRLPKPSPGRSSTQGHRDFAERLSRWAADNLHKLPHDDVDEACRARVKAMGEAGFLAPTVPAIYGGSHPQLDVRTLCLAREILGYHDGLADFAFAMQGLGTGSITLYGTPELKERYLPNVGKGQEHRGLRHFRTRSRFGCRGAEDDGGAGRQRACPPERQQDLDIERRHRRSLRGVRPHRRGARRARAVGLHGRCRHAGPERAGAHRGDRAASARDVALRQCARAGEQPSRRAGRGLQGGDVDARYLPLDRRRRRARLRAPRAARNDRARRHPQIVRRAARRSAAHARRARRLHRRCR